ncbi:hypothetical protein ABVT39_007730 [Epinephelus coioides]
MPITTACDLNTPHTPHIRIISPYMCRLCFYKINMCANFALNVVKTFLSLVFVETITLSNYTSRHQPSSRSAHLATATLLSNSCRLLEILSRLTKPEGRQALRFSGSPLPPPPPVARRSSSSPLRLNCPLTVNSSSVNSFALLPLETITGARASRTSRRGKRRRRRARGVHLLWRSSRHSCVGGLRSGANQSATLTSLCSRCVRR